MPDTDLILYVSADCSDLPGGAAALASACQLESELDRSENCVCLVNA